MFAVKSLDGPGCAQALISETPKAGGGAKGRRLSKALMRGFGYRMAQL